MQKPRVLLCCCVLVTLKWKVRFQKHSQCAVQATLFHTPVCIGSLNSSCTFINIVSHICTENAGDTNTNVPCKPNIQMVEHCSTLIILPSTSAIYGRFIHLSLLLECDVYSLFLGCSSPPRESHVNPHLLQHLLKCNFLNEAKLYHPIKITSHPTLYPIFCPISPPALSTFWHTTNITLPF